MVKRVRVKGGLISYLSPIFDTTTITTTNTAHIPLPLP